MKNVIKRIGYLTRACLRQASNQRFAVPHVIIAIVAVVGFSILSLTGCGGNDNDPVPQTATYTGVSGGTTYMLKITENTARYTAQNGDAYELTAGSKKSTGKVNAFNNGVFTLKPSNAETTFNASVSGNGLTGFSGSVKWDGETTAIPLPTKDDFTTGEDDGDEEDTTPTFTGIEEFNTWLVAQPDNTVATAYKVKLNVSDFGTYTQGQTLRTNTTKYINLDLSGSTFTSMQDTLCECSNLTGIIIPNSVTVIGNYAINTCGNLTSVTIPSSVKSIGKLAFAGDPKLTSVTFNGTIPSSQFSTDPDNAFFGDLRTKFYATDAANGTPGTYTTTAPVSGTSVWAKQP